MVKDMENDPSVTSLVLTVTHGASTGLIKRRIDMHHTGSCLGIRSVHQTWQPSIAFSYRRACNLLVR